MSDLRILVWNVIYLLHGERVGFHGEWLLYGLAITLGNRVQDQDCGWVSEAKKARLACVLGT